MFAQTALVGAAAAGHFTGVYTYDTLIYGGGKFARLCTQAHARGLLCAPSVGPGLRRAAGDRRPARQAASPRADVRLDVARGDRRRRRPASRSRRSTSGRRARRSSPPPRRPPRRVPLRLLRRRLGPPRRRLPKRHISTAPPTGPALFRSRRTGVPGARRRWPPDSCPYPWPWPRRTVSAPLAQLPNALTIARLVVIPIFAVLILDVRRRPQLAGRRCSSPLPAITDQIDGYLARRWHVESAFGKIADPLADRLLIDVAVVLLWHAGRLPWVALAIPARDVAADARDAVRRRPRLPVRGEHRSARPPRGCCTRASRS